MPTITNRMILSESTVWFGFQKLTPTNTTKAVVAAMARSLGQLSRVFIRSMIAATRSSPPDEDHAYGAAGPPELFEPNHRGRQVIVAVRSTALRLPSTGRGACA